MSVIDFNKKKIILIYCYIQMAWKCRNSLFRFLCFISPLSISAQQNFVDSVQANFSSFQQHRIQEKIYVHTDKPFYMAGEIMWFKLYNVDGNFNKPLDLSKIAYLELLNVDQQAILQAKIALDSGSGDGSFLLPLSLTTGNYRLRAYTSWMKNFSPDYYFQKDITIINSLNDLEKGVYDSTNSLNVRFFPEGGNLLEGVESKIGFSITDKRNKGVNVNGSIVNQNNEVVAHFSPLKFGIGHFIFTPVAENNYKAVIDMGGKRLVYDLPAIYKRGYSMRLIETNSDEATLIVRSNSDSENSDLYLVTHTRQIIKQAAVQQLKNGEAGFSIDKRKLGEGISHFTIFDKGRQPVCERLYFKYPANNLVIEGNTARTKYGSREKIDIDISSHIQGGKEQMTDMSVSVYLLDSLQGPEQKNIDSYLWLSSDIQGEIESPDYYFSEEPGIRDSAMDNLMLTHGWRRFNWDEVAQNNTPAFEFLPEYEGHIITARIFHKLSGLPVPDAGAYLSVPGTDFRLGADMSDKQGLLRFNLDNFYGPHEVVAQTKNNADSLIRVEILSPFSRKISGTTIPEYTYSKNYQDLVLSHSISSQVQYGFFSGKTNYQYPLLKDTVAFFGAPDKSYLLDDFTRFKTMEEVMREYVAEVFVRKHQGKYNFMVENAQYKNFFEENPLVLLDGIPVADINKIIDTDPLTIRKIDVITRNFFLGPFSNKGIVSYTTYKGNPEGYQFDPSSLIMEYDGLQLKRKFYAPEYSSENKIRDRLPDFRELLYWNPGVITNENGKCRLSFFSSDKKGKYVVEIQGLTKEGKPGSKMAFFEVR